MQIHELVSPKRIACGLPAARSKKRLLEQISELLHQDNPDLDEQAAFQSLFDRERLGSTGVGNGVAIPHGRVRGLKHATGAFAVLQDEMDYESLDEKPVRLVFALLVPEQATSEHLQLLSQLAGILGKEENRKRLLQAKSSDEVYKLFCESEKNLDN
jgi:PTS system nitrogen regulatory IIA component